MPNHCTNDLIITGDVDDVRAFAERVIRTGDDEPFSVLEELVPMPQFAADSDKWYSWAIENWDTKWPEYNKHAIDVSDTRLHLRFDTAWSPPMRGLVTISKRFPRLNFVLSYLEEGMGFAGVTHLRDGENIAGFELGQDAMPAFVDDDYDDYADRMHEFHLDLVDAANTLVTPAES